MRYCVCPKGTIDHYFAWDGQRLINNLYVLYRGELFWPKDERHAYGDRSWMR
jgi:hypothetical protein